jgi:S1-C subfamily serine protease
MEPIVCTSQVFPGFAREYCYSLVSTDSGPAIGVYAMNGPRVVNIISLSIVPGNSGIAQPSGVGSGFVYDDQGRIVTNDHVIPDANQIQRTFKDRRTQPAKLVGRDPDNDLAVIQVDSLGVAQPGGPLFDSAGNVIGVNTAIASQSGGSEGIGFAIPTNVVKRVVPQLLQYGRYRHPQLGVVGIPISDMTRQARQLLGVPASVELGLLVVQATDAAQQAGVQAGTTLAQVGNLAVPLGGDIVLSIDGRSVGSTAELRAYIENNKMPGDSVTLTILRNGQQIDIPVTLSERPAQF